MSDNFDVGRFVESFPVLAAAEGGVKQLRTMVLSLAVQGLLVPQIGDEESTKALLKRLCKASEREKGDAEHEGRLRCDLLDEVPSPPWQVPSSWRFIRLEQAATAGGLFCDGDWVESKDQDPGGEIRLTQLADVGDGLWRDRSNRSMNRRTAEKLRCTYLKVGDVLIARMPDPIGRACIFPGDRRPCATVVDVAVLRVRTEFFDANFLAKAVNSGPVRQVINGMIAGTTRQRVSRSNLASVLIPVPPLAEQKRIVAKVDQLLGLIDELEAKQTKKREVQTQFRTSALDALTKAEGPEELASAWKRVVGNFEVLLERGESVGELRGSILSLALSGRLESHEPSANALGELAKRKPGAIAAAAGDEPLPLPEHWCWAHLEQLLAVVTDGDHQAPPQVPSGVHFLTIGNVTSGTIKFNDSRFVPKEYFQKLDPRRVPRRGDILYTVVGATYGRPAPVDGDTPFCVQRHIAILKPDGSCDRDYMLLFLRSPLAYKQATASLTGTAQPTVPLKPLRRFLVPLPPLAEQKRIVAKVENLMKLCDDLEARLNTKEETAGKLVEAVVNALVA